MSQYSLPQIRQNSSPRVHIYIIESIRNEFQFIWHVNGSTLRQNSAVLIMQGRFSQYSSHKKMFDMTHCLRLGVHIIPKLTLISFPPGQVFGRNYSFCCTTVRIFSSIQSHPQHLNPKTEKSFGFSIIPMPLSWINFPKRPHHEALAKG